MCPSRVAGLMAAGGLRIRPGSLAVHRLLHVACSRSARHLQAALRAGPLHPPGRGRTASAVTTTAAAVSGRPPPAVPLDCEHFDRCSGCSLATGIEVPPAFDEARNFFADYGVPNFQLHTGDVHEWRCRVRMAVRGSVARPKIGLFESGTHNVITIPHCRVHHPRINQTVELVTRVITSLKIFPYNERTGKGELRYIQLTANTHPEPLEPSDAEYADARVQVVLVWNASDETQANAARLRECVDEIWKQGGGGDGIVHSVWGNFQPAKTNTILGKTWAHMAGPRELWEHPNQAGVCYTPGSFMQANTRAYGLMLRKIAEHVPEGSHVVELYAGVGGISLSLAATRQLASVSCVEINPAVEEPFRLGRARLPKDMQARISMHIDAADNLPTRWLSGSDVVVVDPPRKGLGPAVMSALLDQAQQTDQPGGKEVLTESVPHTLVYMSCGWNALKRDTAMLVEDGKWEVSHAEAIQFFPGTDSLETLCIFKRCKA